MMAKSTNAALILILLICPVLQEDAIEDDIRPSFIKKGLTAVPKNINSYATHLTLSVNDIRKLNKGDFERLFQLMYLKLDNNRLHTSSDLDAIEEAKNLEHLDISFNNILVLDFKVFSRNFKLSILEINRNPKMEIKDNSANLLNLKSLSLQANDLNQFPSGVFKGFSSLEVLDISLNNITELDFEIFSANHNLWKLTVDSNPYLQIIHKSVYLRSLTWLSLQWNNLVTIPSQVFERLPNLEVLDISHNHIRILDFTTFKINIKLQTFNADYNRNMQINNKLVNLPDLATISLQGNNLHELSSVAFGGFPSLKILDVHSNKCIQIPSTFFNISHTLEIKVDNCTEEEQEERLYNKTTVEPEKPNDLTTTPYPDKSIPNYNVTEAPTLDPSDRIVVIVIIIFVIMVLIIVVGLCYCKRTRNQTRKQGTIQRSSGASAANDDDALVETPLQRPQDGVKAKPLALVRYLNEKVFIKIKN